MELTLYTEGFFDAAHFIPEHPGKCVSMHVHSWKVCVWVQGDSKNLNNQGILWDFGNIKTLIEPLDHQILNNILKKAPTAENLVEYFYDNLKEKQPELKFRIRVYENTLSRQSYCEGGDSFNA